MMPVNDYVSVINTMLVTKKTDEITKLIKNYIARYTLKDKKGNKGELIYEKDSAILYVVQDGRYQKGEAEDLRDFSNAIDKVKLSLDSLNDIVGFITTFKNEYKVFKTKQMERKRHKGARCDQAGKAETLRLLNIISDSERYTIESTKEVGHKELCVVMELLLRVLDYKKANNKRWFISPAIAAESQLEKMSFV